MKTTISARLIGILVNKNSKIAIQGITGREASMVTKHALAYGTKICAKLDRKLVKLSKQASTEIKGDKK